MPTRGCRALLRAGASLIPASNKREPMRQTRSRLSALAVTTLLAVGALLAGPASGVAAAGAPAPTNTMSRWRKGPAPRVCSPHRGNTRSRRPPALNRASGRWARIPPTTSTWWALSSMPSARAPSPMAPDRRSASTCTTPRARRRANSSQPWSGRPGRSPTPACTTRRPGCWRPDPDFTGTERNSQATALN